MNVVCKYRLVLFDLDGTLVDSSPGIVNSLQHALAIFDVSATEATLKALIGPPVPEILRQLAPDIFCEPKHVKRALRAQRDYYARQGVYESVVYPGIELLLQGLKQQGKQLIIATSKPTVFAKKIIAHHGLTSYFHRIVGSYLSLKRSRKIDIIDHILQRTRFEKTAICMIGDRHHDLDAAQALGIASIGVSYGYGELQEIVACCPTDMAHSVTELGSVLLAESH